MASKTHSAKLQVGKHPEDACHLYVLGCGNKVKVGITEDLLRRVTALSAGNPGGLSIDASRYVARGSARRLEAAVHRRLRPYALGREWFATSWRRAVAAIDAVLAAEPPVDPGAIAAAEARSATEAERRMVKYMDGVRA